MLNVVPLKNLLAIYFLLVFVFVSPITKAITLISKHPPQVQKILTQAPTLDPKVLKLALTAYKCAKQQQDLDPRGILTIIDYSIPSEHRRLWVIDLDTNTIPFHTLVAQGHEHGTTASHMFSDIPNTLESSVGLMKTGGAYVGPKGYSLQLIGLEEGFNDKVFMRHIVFHGAWYVSDSFVARMGRVGHSWGCPALREVMVKPVINEIKNGTLVFAYYPYQKWLTESKFLHCELDETPDTKTTSDVAIQPDAIKTKMPAEKTKAQANQNQIPKQPQEQTQPQSKNQTN